MYLTPKLFVNMFNITAGRSLRAWHSDGHFIRTVGGVALLPGVVVVGGLGWVLPLDMLAVPWPSSSYVHCSIGLAKEIWHVLYALLPTG